MIRPIQEEIKRKILILDGATGTMIQRLGLGESDYRGSEFKAHSKNVMGLHDLLCLTRPDSISAIHEAYLASGADIIETNTFNANRFSLSDYGLEKLAYRLNREGAAIARKAADNFIKKNPARLVYVAGSVGPTNRSASLSPDVNRPEFRNVTFDELVEAYREQIQGLLDGGVDLLLIETVFDTLNAKAALSAARDVFTQKSRQLPLIVSVTLSDASGRTLTGQTLEAFYASISHAKLLAVGLNCGLGASQLKTHVATLAAICQSPVAIYPNAGLPNAFGQYDETPQVTAGFVEEFAKDGLVNIVGGCCGTTPDHIRAIAEVVQKYPPRKCKSASPLLTRLSGLEEFVFRKEILFVNVGERTNVLGSKKFAKCILDKRFDEALSIARDQIESGAQIIDVNLDEAMLDSKAAMVQFLNLAGQEPLVARVPVMVDSSRWDVLEAGLKCLQGKGIVNSISLKDGEEEFLRRAAFIRRIGAAVIVMAADESGQAASAHRKIEILCRAYDLLTAKLAFPPEDIIFDPVVLTIGTGLEEHSNYAVEFIHAARELRRRFNACHISGGISNLSFSFRGHERIRQAIHVVFLYHAAQAGLDMGIVNPSSLVPYPELEITLRELAEDLVLNRKPDATERLLTYAASGGGTLKARPETEQAWRKAPAEERLAESLVRGMTDFLNEDLTEMKRKIPSALAVIEGPLLDGMKTVGNLFGEGKMFLPQVIKSARVMKKAVAFLEEDLRRENASAGRSSSGKVMLATVKGDAHDIGKNIVAVVLGCNHFEVIDLGIMVPTDKIIEAVKKEKPDVLGLSGLITPSLDEMMHVARELERAGLTLPLLIGGATTSAAHTAVKIAPCYRGPVIHVLDASRSVEVVKNLLSAQRREEFIKKVNTEYASVRQRHEKASPEVRYASLEEARKNSFVFEADEANLSKPPELGVKILKDYPLKKLIPYIDWSPFFHLWEFRGKYPEILKDSSNGAEASKLFGEAQKMLERIDKEKWLRINISFGLFPASSAKGDVTLYESDRRDKVLGVAHFLRQQLWKNPGEPYLSLADFVAPTASNQKDYLGLFAITAGIGVDAQGEVFAKDKDDYNTILLKALATRLAEAASEELHERIRKEFWKYAPDERLTKEDLLNERYRGIRPAPGYPACPDHTEKTLIFKLLDVEKNVGIRLTENFAMSPLASTCGYYFAHPKAKYFSIGKIGKDQVVDYAARKAMTVSEIERWLGPNLNYVP